jgi:hypothetical protein
LFGLARTAVLLGEDCRHPLAILQALACHRYQKLHRHLCRHFALAHKKVTGFQRRIRQIVAQMRADGLSPRDVAIELRLIAEKLEA